MVRSSNAQEKKPWFGRVDKIADQLQSHRAWVVQTRGELVKAKEDLEKALTQITPDIAQIVETEKSLMVTRVRAIKLVLSQAESVEDDDEVTRCGVSGFQ